MNRSIRLAAPCVVGVLLAGCGLSSQEVPVPDRLQSVVRELVRAVDTDADPRFDGLLCFHGPVDAHSQDGERWSMSVSIAGRPDELIERVRAAGVELGWQPMRPLRGFGDLVVADHHRFADPLEVAVRKTRQGVDLWMLVKSDNSACGDEPEHDEPPPVVVDTVWPTDEQRAALDSTAAAVGTVPELIASALGGRYREPSYRVDPYEGCVVGDRSGARWVNRTDGLELPDTYITTRADLRNDEAELVAALPAPWYLADRIEQPGEDGADKGSTVELRFRADVGVGATVTVRIDWSFADTVDSLELTPVRTACVPPSG
jgi:hypothetical protein